MRGDDGSGSSSYKSVVVMARQGHTEALALLKGPQCPEYLEHYVTWTLQLFGKSGTIGMGQLGPLTHTTLYHWRDLYGHVLDRIDIDVLFVLNMAMMDPAAAIREVEQDK